MLIVSKINEKSIATINKCVFQQEVATIKNTLLPTTKVLVQGDLYSRHMLFHQNKLTGIIDWGDVGPISINPDASVVMGDVGFGVLPGGEEYWDYEKGVWVTPESGANTAPFIAFGGWIISVAADSDVKEAALDFAAFMSAPDMVKKLAVSPDTGINPSRFSQLEDVDMWVDAGFDLESAEDYLDAIKNTINHPNAVLDIRITGSAEYLQTLDVEISRAVAGEADPQEALDNVAKAWDEITDRLGRENQLQQYRSAVGWSE